MQVPRDRVSRPVPELLVVPAPVPAPFPARFPAPAVAPVLAPPAST
jgi:hypothetical protein